MSKPSNRGEQLLALRNLQIPKCDVRKLSSVVCKAVIRCVDDHGSTCWASQASIASEANTSVRSVNKALDYLEALGLVSKKVDRSHKTDTYFIVWERVSYATVADLKEQTGLQLEQSGMQLEQSGMQLESISSATVADKARRNEIETRKKRKSAPARKFSPPSLIDVQSLWKAKSLKGNPEKFFYHYEANGWTQGRRSKPLEKWQAAAHKWSTNEKDFDLKPTFSGKAKTVNLGPGVNYDPNRSTANVKF